MSPRIRPIALQLSLAVSLAAVTFIARAPLSAQQVVRRTDVPVGMRSSADLVSAEQLRTHPDLPTAFRVVEALHSNWMLERGVRPQPAFRVPDGARSVAGENGGVQVYLDGHRLGGTELLRTIPSANIYSIRHLSGIAAQARFGVGHSEGVIWIATNPGWDKTW